jgi:uncharacterized RDD family membrane protein YckC
MAAERPPIEPSAPGSDRASTPAKQSDDGGVGGLIEATGRIGVSVARLGWRGTRGVARRLGVDRAVGRAIERPEDRAPATTPAEHATERLLESDTARRVWGKVLESDEAQKLVERVAEAPEVRSAIAAQGVGLLEDLRRGVRRVARRLDTEVERAARTLLRRRFQPGEPTRAERPIYAGPVSRALAVALDAGAVYGVLLLISAAIALLISAVSSGEEGAGTVVLALGFTAWSLIAAAYLVFLWSGAGRTLGMSFLGLRLISEDGEGVTPGQAIHRVIWLALSALPLMLGFWGILFEERRRGWADRHARTLVVYADPDLDNPDPRSRVTTSR